MNYERGEIKKEFEEELERFATKDSLEKYAHSDNIYDLVWQMEQECGNPRVRTQMEGYGFTPVSDFGAAAHYTPYKNTIYISLYDLYFHNPDNSIVAEMSHAKQYKENPIGTHIRFARDAINVLRSAGINSPEAIGDEYRKLYQKPGSVEHEAHKVIEPYLMSKYRLFVEKENEKQE